MHNTLIYADSCCDKTRREIKQKLGMDVLLMFPKSAWSVNEAMKLITNPDVRLAVVNEISDQTMMEIGLLHFMCKPILVTTNAVTEYPCVYTTVDYIDSECNLRSPHNNFIQWLQQTRKNYGTDIV